LTDSLKSLIKSSAKEGFDLTIVLMPYSSRNAKRSENPYGAFHAGRSSPGEEVLSKPVAFVTSEPESASSQVEPVRQPVTTRGIIPTCHTSLDSCIEATSNCSGHGSCFLKFTSKDEDAETGTSCYACGCEATIVKTDSGIQKTYWGGSACQKKDISVPFFLLFGFTILLVGMVSWAIGMLYSIGEEKLPSVIGAGVAPSKAR
jgi:hypothetical protein